LERSKSIIGHDQFAYKKRTNTTSALVKCQHHWLKWLDEGAEFVRVLSFDFSKAFDSVPHDIVTEKPKQTNLTPYIINWIISLLTNRKQRVVVDGIITEYVDINKGVPQGTVIGPFLFFLMVDDIKPKQPETNVLVKDVHSVLRISSAHNKGGPPDINIAQILHLSNFFELSMANQNSVRYSVNMSYFTNIAVQNINKVRTCAHEWTSSLNLLMT
jgi:hypothetical protein